MNRQLIGGLVLALTLVLGPVAAQARYLNPNTGRFQTMDSYEGNTQDPASLHKYLYCQGNPVNHLDPSGHKIVPPSGEKDKAEYNKAVDYLLSAPKAKEVIDKLKGCENTYAVLAQRAPITTHNTEPGDAYDGDTRTVYWLPYLGLRWRKAWGGWNELTPALCLMHELGHAYHHELDPTRYLSDLKPYPTPGDWWSDEEKRTVKEIENVVAKQLGEPIRPQYLFAPGWAETYITTGSTVTIQKVTGFIFSDTVESVGF